MRPLMFLVLFPFIFPMDLQGQTKRMRSIDLGSVIGTGDKIDVVSRTGGHAEATVEMMSSETIMLKVSRTSNAAEMPIGIVSMDLKNLAEVKVCKMNGRKRKIPPVILASTVGTLSFLAAGASEEQKGRFLPMAAGPTAGVTIGGYFAGRAFDRECTTYLIER